MLNFFGNPSIKNLSGNSFIIIKIRISPNINSDISKKIEFSFTISFTTTLYNKIINNDIMHEQLIPTSQEVP